jgi:hypothetical protein
MQGLNLARAAAGALLLTVAGCAQSPQSGSVSTEKKRPPTDHWQTSPSHRLATLSSLDRKAVLVLGCDEDILSLVVVPERRPPAEKGRRPVTIILDRNTSIIQDWYAGAKGGYGTGDIDPGFMTLLEALQKHQEVEFVLKRSDTDIDDHSFTLNGARAAIDAVLNACGKS